MSIQSEKNHVGKMFKCIISQNLILFADLHWDGFTTQWGDKKRINGADKKIYELGGISEVRLEPFFSH